jgi:hypothetical protein
MKTLENKALRRFYRKDLTMPHNARGTKAAGQ